MSFCELRLDYDDNTTFPAQPEFYWDTDRLHRATYHTYCSQQYSSNDTICI